MLGISWLSSRLIHGSRISYNLRNYHSSRRRARFAHLLKPSRNSFDLLARSNLRLKKYSTARNLYFKAESKGHKLLDHNVNLFKASIGSASLVNAYQVALRFTKKDERNIKIKIIKSHLVKLSEEDQIKIIEEMAQTGNLSSIISKILPGNTNLQFKNKIKDKNHKQLSSEGIILDRHRREISRLKSSGAYQILDHISSSLHSPMKLLLLPFSISSLSLKLIKGRLGTLSIKKPPIVSSNEDYEQRNSIILFPTNGVGFGHFTRMMALAKAIRKESKDTEIVFFTTMPTLHLLSEEGFIGYHMPGRYKYDSMEPKIWNTLCEEMLNLILLQHSPSHFIFDGAYPYRGMLNAISNWDSRLTKIWLKRGSIKQGVKKLPVDSYGFFDAILRPGDSVKTNFSDEVDNGVILKEVSPLLIYDQSSSDSNQSLRQRLDIPDNSVLAYVQLGAGQINNIENLLSIILRILSNYPQCHIIMAESLIGERLNVGQKRLRLLRDFPNSRWFRDIDFSIIAGGYNSYHEMVEFCIPSIIIPNTNTGRDDQVKRIQNASSIGAMVMLKNPNKVTLEAAIDRIMESEVRSLMESRIEKLRKPNGAVEAAKWILHL